MTSSVEVIHRRDISPAHRESETSGATRTSSHFVLNGENHTGRESDAHSDVISISGTSANGTDASHNPDSPVSTGLTMASSPSISSQSPSWIEGYDSQHPGAAGPSNEFAMPTSLHQHGHGQPSVTGSPRSHIGAYLSDSYMSDSYTSASVNASDVEHSRTVRCNTLHICCNLLLRRSSARWTRAVNSAAPVVR